MIEPAQQGGAVKIVGTDAGVLMPGRAQQQDTDRFARLEVLPLVGQAFAGGRSQEVTTGRRPDPPVAFHEAVGVAGVHLQFLPNTVATTLVKYPSEVSIGCREETADQVEELTPLGGLQLLPNPKGVLRRCLRWGGTGPGILWIRSIESQRWREIFDPLGQFEAFLDRALPAFIPFLIAQLLLCF